VSATPWQ
jgi:ABC-type uncharacterized transport system substrate-binding protein